VKRRLWLRWIRTEQTVYRGEENVKSDIWTGGRARNAKVRTDQELREVYKDIGIVPVISGFLSPRHGASSGWGWRNGLQYGG
jgi:hypothetical protein